jgi:hypothetical protein
MLIQRSAEFLTAVTCKLLTVWSRLMDHRKAEFKLICKWGKGWKIKKSNFYFLNRLWAVFPGISRLGPASLIFTFPAHGPARGPAEPPRPTNSQRPYPTPQTDPDPASRIRQPGRVNPLPGSQFIPMGIFPFSISLRFFAYWSNLWDKTERSMCVLWFGAEKSIYSRAPSMYFELLATKP